MRCLFDIGASDNRGASFDIEYTGGPATTDDLTAVADGVEATFVTDLLGQLSTNNSLVEVLVNDTSQPELPEGRWSGSEVGTRTGAGQIAGQSSVLVYNIARRYRGSRPKGFWPFGTATDWANSESWTSDFISGLEASWANFITSLGELAGLGITLGAQVGISYTGPPYHVVTSPTTGRGRNVGTPKDPPVVFPVSSVTCSKRFGSQRRRYGKPA